MVPEQSMAGDGAPRLGRAARGGDGIWMDGAWWPLLCRAAVSRPSGGSGEPGCRDRRERRSRPRQSMMADASESLAKAQSPQGTCSLCYTDTDMGIRYDTYRIRGYALSQKKNTDTGIRLE